MAKVKKKANIDKNPDVEKFDFIKTVKGNINGVVKDEHIEQINQMAIRINKIVIYEKKERTTTSYGKQYIITASRL